MSSKSVNIKREMQCKVCMDAGKPKSLYSSHWVKDNNGKVVCPTLLSVVCPNCSNKGHTVKFCTVSTMKERTTPVCEKKTNTLKKIVGDFPVLSSKNITLRPHQKHFAEEDTSSPCYMDLLTKLREAKAKREAEEAKNIVEKPCLIKDKTIRGCGSANITLRAHQKHYEIEEGEIYDPFFGSEKKKEISMHNRECFLGNNGLSWIDVIDSESEGEDNEEFEEDYDW